MEFEISYTQEITVNVELSERRVKSLIDKIIEIEELDDSAKMRAEIRKTIRNDTIMDEHSDGVIVWLSEIEASNSEITERTDPDNIEFHV